MYKPLKNIVQLTTVVLNHLEISFSLAMGIPNWQRGRSDIIYGYL